MNGSKQSKSQRYQAAVTLEQTADGREQGYINFSPPLPSREKVPHVYNYMAKVFTFPSWMLRTKPTKEGRKLNDDVIYRATFTLEQEGLDGQVTPKLEFVPKVDNPKDAPAIYGYMSNELLKFLRMVNIIDENNEVINKEYFDDVEMHLTDEDNGETRQ